jgi:hypothetical protein
MNRKEVRFVALGIWILVAFLAGTKGTMELSSTQAISDRTYCYEVDTGTGPDDRCGYASHEECKTVQRDDPTALSNCFKQKKG